MSVHFYDKIFQEIFKTFIEYDFKFLPVCIISFDLEETLINLFLYSFYILQNPEYVHFKESSLKPKETLLICI